MENKKSKYKIGIIGFFGFGTNLGGGQAVKTRSIYSFLKTKYNHEMIECFDTLNWKREPFRFFFRMIVFIHKCTNIVLLPAHKGIRIILPIILFFNFFHKKNVIYPVVGGWLPDLSRKHCFFRNNLKNIDYIMVETAFMKKRLEQQGFKNISLLRNAKDMNSIRANEISVLSSPLKVCTFSRIRADKGIAEAIKAVEIINNMNLFNIKLTIFGAIDSDSIEWFERMKVRFPSNVSYGGLVDTLRSVDTLKNYDVLLFPTKFKTEGFPGTILDGLASGLVIVASDIPSCREILKDGQVGYLLSEPTPEKIVEAIIDIYNNPAKSMEYKKNAVNEYQLYTSDVIYNKLIDAIR